MFWYQMKINSFKGKYCMHVKTDTIMYTSLHLNQLACQLCISCRMSSFLFPNTLCRTEHLKSILVILIIQIIVNLIGLNLSSLWWTSLPVPFHFVPFRKVPIAPDIERFINIPMRLVHFQNLGAILTCHRCTFISLDIFTIFGGGGEGRHKSDVGVPKI